LSPALTVSAVKLVLDALAALHATGHHWINSFPGGRSALAQEVFNKFIS
jgi:hypothetical protein